MWGAGREVDTEDSSKWMGLFSDSSTPEGVFWTLPWADQSSAEYSVIFQRLVKNALDSGSQWVLRWSAIMSPSTTASLLFTYCFPGCVWYCPASGHSAFDRTPCHLAVQTPLRWQADACKRYRRNTPRGKCRHVHDAPSQLDGRCDRNVHSGSHTSWRGKTTGDLQDVWLQEENNSGVNRFLFNLF